MQKVELVSQDTDKLGSGKLYGTISTLKGV